MRPTRDEIQRLAYQFWEERGCPLDSPDIDWWRAEQKLLESAPPETGDGDRPEISDEDLAGEKPVSGQRARRNW
jgi:hypothetical protein